ncbi:hypothetical protein ACFP47_02075 [Nesterenkonia lacusekhoensis]|uniref:DUF5642 domain-containing protein n=1 Tax=Nesterenkonia lacusekhoensis TaxID=150832 RepID=A0ABS4T4A9_9MICC|nr:hypothetical protein [Nesterenkonia lacusekhoensis]MBP2318804.1 hypothetical protein [Nesterenkonia lacusekhoensis]
MSTARHPGGKALAAVAVGLLALTACGEDETDAVEGDDSPPAGSDRLIEAAEAGLDRAGSFGFGSAGFATEDQLETTRAEAADMLPGTSEEDIRPAECAEPIANVDFQPIMLEEDAARADFVSETFTGTGSLEIATLSDDQDRQLVEDHIGHVTELVESCGDMEITLEDMDYRYEIGPVELESLPAETSVGYTRTQRMGEDGEDGTIAAQMLFTQSGDDVVMVSFIGEEAANSEEFTQIGEAITTEIVSALDEEQ